MSQSLNDFFRNKQARASTSGVDWPRRLREWILAVEGLYSQIEGYLADAIDRRDVSLVRRPIQVSEDHLGTYQLNELVLTVGDEQVFFTPKGRNVVGAQGRLDVRGEAGTATLVRQPDRWCVIATRTPVLRIETFDLGTFTEVIEAVMRQEADDDGVATDGR